MGKIILSTLYDDRRNGEYQNLFKNIFFNIFFTIEKIILEIKNKTISIQAKANHFKPKYY